MPQELTDEQIARIWRDRWQATQPRGTATFDELSQIDRAKLTARVCDFRAVLDLVRPQGE